MNRDHKCHVWNLWANWFRFNISAVLLLSYFVVLSNERIKAVLVQCLLGPFHLHIVTQARNHQYSMNLAMTLRLCEEAGNGEQ